MKKLAVGLLLSLLLLPACQATTSQEVISKQQTPAQQDPIQLEETKVPSWDEGVQLYLRHKFDGSKPIDKKKVVLFLEPFSVPTAKAFDVPGYSWMEEYAKKGYDTWAMDFRGFGDSTRPKEMDAPPTSNKPVVTHEEALKDLTAVVEYIKKTQKVDKVHLVGWSYGAVIAGKYAAEQPQNVDKLVLHGFMHGFELPFMTEPMETKEKPGQLNEQFPAYQVVDFAKGMHHWHMMLGNKQLVTDDAMKKVQEVFEQADPATQKQMGKTIRRPHGPLVDLYYIWKNQPLYDLGKIKSPVLIIRGNLDLFAEKEVLSKLTGTKVKKEVIIPDATHWVLYEKNRQQLLDEVDRFLSSEK